MRIKNRDGGMITAETAVVLPVVVAIGAVLLWLVLLGVTQARVTDAAREAARMVARGDSVAAARKEAAASAPAGAAIDVDQSGDRVTVTVTARTAPKALDLPGTSITATAVAMTEDGS